MENDKEQQQMEGGAEGEANVEDFLEILEEHRINCQREGKYVEAEMAKNRIEELKAQETQKKREGLMLKHQNERLEIEEAHLQEYDNFNKAWDKKMQEFQEHSMELVRQLEDKHIKEIEDNRAVLE